MAATKARKEKSADALRSIGEAAAELGLQTHVLRYWEGKFPRHIKPIKRTDGRRLFRPRDMEALKAIQILVHDRGLTLKGANALLREQGVDTVLKGEARLLVADSSADAAPVASPARNLQQAVSRAFGAPMKLAAASQTKSVGSPESLRTVLTEITDLKLRLDAMRSQQAA
ncbi:MAG: MerR family transcriptional regulator [Pseudomonadota bacterium]